MTAKKTPVSAAPEQATAAQTTGTPAEAATTQVTGATADVQITGAETIQAATVSSPVAPDITFSVGGAATGQVTVPFGTKVKDALKKISDKIVASSLQLRDAAGKAVGLDRELKETLAVTAVQKASGS